MNKPFTLYCGYRERNEATSLYFLPTTKVIKIENIYKISKPLMEPSKNQTNCFYALVGEELNVLGLGILKELKSKEEKTIYVGQYVITTEKKILCDYYKQKAYEHIKKMNSYIIYANKMAKVKDDNVARFYEQRIKLYNNVIQQTKIQYKQVVENIKQL